MVDKQLNFQDLFYFIKIVEQGSLAAASDKLDIPTSTLSRRLIALEKQVGFQLLHRSSRTFGLTDAGTRFYQRLKTQFNEIEFQTVNVISELSGLTGDIKISAPLSFGRHIVNKWVVEFMKAHPNISVEILLSNQPIDLVKHGVDLAIRLGNLDISDWVGRDLADISYNLVASTEYLTIHGQPSDPKQLESMPSITTSSTPLWRLNGPTGKVTVHPHSHYKSDVVSACVDATIAGIGISLLPSFAIKQHLETGRLKEVLTDWKASSKKLRALYPHRNNMPAKNRTFIDFIIEKARAMDL